MTLRQRMLLMFSLVVVTSIGFVAWLVSLRTRSAFERVDQQHSAALVAQFRGEFGRESEEVARTLHRVAASDRVQRLTVDVSHGGDTSLYVGEAETLAQEFHLDLLEIVAADGTIVSSAQWPARFGYKVQVPPITPGTAALHRQELADGAVLAVEAVQPVKVADGTVFLVGGKKLDRSFLANFALPTGSYVWLYRYSEPQLTPQDLLGDATPAFDELRSLLERARLQQETSGIVQMSAERLDRATVQAIPLRDDTGNVVATLLVGTSRKPLLELQRNIRAIALGIAGIGILLAVGATLWIAAAFSRPIEHLAVASAQLAGGDWNVKVPVESKDELGQLAEAFNQMTLELIEQRGRLVQAERVASWRELARRLAHELKNPLFPLQITIENLVRARDLSDAEFDEVFRESTTTLLAELGNLKAIISRFSDFSKMPKPQLQQVSINQLVKRVTSTHEAQLKNAPKPISLVLDLADAIPEVPLDPDLMHRVLANLMLNAVDAMPAGGTLSVATRDDDDSVRLEVADTGTGLTSEEKERLFTPYYTTKHHGTGLGLAIVQSVVSDHQGTISVESDTGRGTRFVLLLPKHQPGSALQQSQGARA